MASIFESLPGELLEKICLHIDPTWSEPISEDYLVSTRCTGSSYAHLSNLVRTSKSLHFHVEPILYVSKAARTVALYRAIRDGNVDTIRKAIFYGASPDVLQVQGSGENKVLDWTTSSWSVPTLYLALKFRQTSAFKVLVEQGADINHPALWECPDDPSSKGGPACENLMHHLCKSENERSLRLLLEAHPIRHIPLVPVIGWASPELIQLLLDKHADPNELYPCSSFRFLSPLSAAILAHSPEIFKLLASRGADVNGRDVPGDQPFMHIPVFAAATQMVEGTSGLAMMQLCLDYGADINRLCHEPPGPFSFKVKWQDVDLPHVCTTVLLTFLKSIKSWNASSGTMRPIEGLQFLLDFGASAVSPPSKEIQRKYHNTQQYIHDRTFHGASSTVELLLDKWGLDRLAQPDFFRVLELLIRHGAARPFFARILVKYDSVENPEWAHHEAVSNWQRLLDLLIADMRETRVDLDAVLRRVIADKGRLRKTLAYTPWRGVGEIGRASIDALIEAGADINARIEVPFKEATSSGRDTALQEVCAAIIHTDGLHDAFHDHADGHLCEFSLMNEKAYSDWFAFLISRGADPFVEDTHSYREGESAISIMMSPMEEGRTKTNGLGSLEKHMMRLVAVLKSTSEPLVYEGERAPYVHGDDGCLFGWRWREPTSGKACLAR